MAELADWLHHESVTRAATNSGTSYNGQICIFPEQRFWIPAVDNDSRMWECPECGKRMFGEPLHWYQFNYYRFCPYCGTRLYTDPKLVDEGGLPVE